VKYTKFLNYVKCFEDDIGATLLEKGAPFADSAGRPCATDLDWDDTGGLRNPQKVQTGLTAGLGTAFPQKGVPN
jgi:hypothetical protein